MREIKFRAWDKKGERFIERFMVSKNGEILGKDFDVLNESIFSWDNAVLIQYTNLKDKNGKEIYEGDIIAIENNNYDPSNGDNPILLLEVKQEIGAYVIGDYLLRDFESSEMEKVGDIYEYPELLK